MAADPDRNEGLVLYVTGRSTATYWAKVIMGRDMGMLSSVALLVVIALLIAGFRSIMALGLLTAFGVLAAILLSLTFLPAV